MSEVVERVAKIIDPVAFGDYPDDGIDPRHDSTWANTKFAVRERARTVIAISLASIRARVEARQSGCDLAVEHDGSEAAQIASRELEAVLEMIDAALAP